MNRKNKRKNKHLVFPIMMFVILLLISIMTIPFIQKQDNEEIVFSVSAGESIRSVAERLEREHVIGDADLFIMLSKMFNVDRKIKSGNYLLETDSYEYNTLMKMFRGEVILVKLTIPEGFNMFQIAGRVESEMNIDSIAFINVCKDRGLMKKYGLHFASMEGYLYPDTYLLSMGKTAYQVVEMMLKRFNEAVPDSLFSDNAEGFTKHDYIILASMIEKEAVVEFEKSIIAGVYYNRLRKGMYLQCCATVLYSMGRVSGIPTYSETQIESPYNTYRNTGLPPGPICSPGIKSIIAAVNPQVNDYLFYVAKGDGTHIFTHTYKEHIKAQSGL